MAISDTQVVAQPKLHTKNIVNAVAYAINLGVTYGAMASDRLPDNAEISDKYQTLVTPAAYAFGIWGIIFMSELVWTIFQLLPAYRANALVLNGVGYYYAVVCIAQASWTFFFASEKMVAASIAMAHIVVALFMIVKNITGLTHTSVKDFWLLKFPFLTHFAWVFAATILQINVLIVAKKASADVQFYTAIGSLVSFAIVAFYCAIRRVYAVPCVVAWATTAIYIAVSNAPTSWVLVYGADHVRYVKNGSAVVAVASVVLTILAALREVLAKRRLSQIQAESTSAEYTPLNQ